jgi:L-asparagine oxygenase
VPTDGEIADVEELIADLERQYDSPEDPAFLAELGVVAHDLPRRLRSYINEMRLSGRGEIILISGFSIDQERIGPTPADWRPREHADAVRREEFFIALLGSLLGDIFGWATQQDGHLVNDVLPIRGHEDEQLGTASAVELSWHTEDAFHPYRADYIGLLCLRNPQRVPTTVCRLRDVAERNDLPEVLWQPRFLIQPDRSHLPENNSPDVAERLSAQFVRILEMVENPAPVPVLFGSRLAPCWRLDPDFIHVGPGDDEAQDALEALYAAVSSELFDLALAPGELVFLDNHRVVHGRRAFRASYDGNDRWLKRINVTRDLRKSEDMRTSPLVRAIGA